MKTTTENLDESLLAMWRAYRLAYTCDNTDDSQISDFSFGIPSAATIDGIQIQMEANEALSTGDITVDAYLSWNNGATFTSRKTLFVDGTTDATYTFGTSTTDKWGRTWAPSEMANGTFRARIDKLSSSDTLNIDRVQVKVYYTTTGGGGGGTSTSTIRYIHPDHLGSTNVVTDSTGLVTQQVLDYFPYGSTRINSSAGGTRVARQFIGEIADQETSLSYLNARYYDPSRGQFLNQDPVFRALGTPEAERLAKQKQEQLLADPQQLNSYNYARGNPMVNKDPSGNNPLVIAGVAGAVFAVGQQAYMDVYNGQFSGLKVYGTQAVIGGATGVGVALTAMSAPFTAAGIGFYGAYTSSIYGDAYNPTNATGEIDHIKGIAQGAMSLATMGVGRMMPGITGSYPKVSTLVNNFSQNPVKATTNFFWSAHGQRDIMQQLRSTLGALLVELSRLQNSSGSKDAVPPAQSQKKTANRRRRKSSDEMVYEPNKKWIWQTFAFMLILPAFALLLTPKSDPMFYSLLFIIAMVVVIFTTLLRFGNLCLKDGMLTQEDLFKGISIKVGDINKIEVVRHGFWGGTYITTKNSKMNINHSLFDEETRGELIQDLLKINPAISMK